MRSDYSAQAGGFSGAGAAQNGAGGNAAYAHLTPIQRKIMEAVANDMTDEGVHVSTLCRSMGNNAAPQVT